MSGTASSEYSVELAVGKQTKACDVLVESLPPPEGSTLPLRFRVVIEGQSSLLEARRFDERGQVVSWSLIDESGRQRLVDVDGTLPDLKLSVGGGEPISAKVADRRDLQLHASSAGGSAKSGDLRAAMPGKVVKLLCQAGDSVKAGQGLVVIEAMKMENELRAPIAGTVATVAVREGQTVEAGQALVTVTPA